jgi:hypothetical protein
MTPDARETRLHHATVRRVSKWKRRVVRIHPGAPAGLRVRGQLSRADARMKKNCRHVRFCLTKPSGNLVDFSLAMPTAQSAQPHETGGLRPQGGLKGPLGGDSTALSPERHPGALPGALGLPRAIYKAWSRKAPGAFGMPPAAQGSPRVYGSRQGASRGRWW